MAHYFPASTHRKIDALDVNRLDPSSFVTDKGRKYIALLVGKVFRATYVTIDSDTRQTHPSEDHALEFIDDILHGYIYQPIHPSMERKDIDGATYAYDDGTYWHFSHESPGQRYEAEAYAQAKLVAHFQPRINKQSALIHAASDITERTLRHNVLLALNSFVDNALDAISTSIRKLPLGHFARKSPYADNHRALVVASCRSVLADWTSKAVTDTNYRHNVDHIKTYVDELVAALTQAPQILSRVEDLEASKPKIREQISAVTMLANGVPNGIDLRNKFSARDDTLIYEAVSSDTDVATVSVNRGMLVVTPVNAGSATITVRATAPDERYITQTFSVTVVAQ